MRKGRNCKGLTLVEIIVVIVILAILVPTLLWYIDREKNQQMIVNCRTSVLAAQGLYDER